jgi:hypothetical protein
MEKIMKHTCPVCGYPQLAEPAYDEYKNGSHEICSSCYYHFGYDDEAANITHEQWREKWIKDGMPWRSSAKHRPDGWDPCQQLLNIGVRLKSD